MAVTIFTIFMNTAGLLGKFSSGLTVLTLNLLHCLVTPMLTRLSSRQVGLISTSLQVAGVALCALTLSEDSFWTILGFGVLVGSGVGITFMNNIAVSAKTFPQSLSLIFGIALTTICILGASVPEMIKSFGHFFQEERNRSGLAEDDNSWYEGEGQEARRAKLLLYAGLSSVGFVGAVLLGDSQREEIREKGGEVKKTVRQHLADCVRLLSDPTFLCVACVNSTCFSVMLYLVSLAPDVYRCKFSEAGEEEDLTEGIMILKTIFIATNALGYLLFGFSGQRFINSLTLNMVIAVNLLGFCSNPRKFLYQASVLVSGLNILFIKFITSQIIPVMAMLVIFNVVSAVSSAGILMMSNLLYQDYFKNRHDFNTAVALSNVMRGAFALLINPLSSLFPDLYFLLVAISTLMITLIVFWMLVELFCSSRSQFRPVQTSSNE